VNHATVLGASGFIGSRLSAELKGRGVDVLAPARDADLSGEDLGTVFYCIGLTGDAPRRPFETVKAHVEKLSEVLRRCRFDQIVYLSSTRLYLGAPVGNEDGELRIDPNDRGRVFNLSKALGESLVLQDEWRGRIVRLSNVYGPDWESESFLPTILTTACRDGAVTIRDAPESAKDYVHVQDAVQALIRIALEGREPLYNVASGRNVGSGELAEELRRVADCTVDFGAGAATVVFPPIDTARLQAEFPFSPRSVLDDLPGLVDECRAWLKRSPRSAARGAER
jgi:nucleoside-diphosphate-sugar epimerase